MSNLHKIFKDEKIYLNHHKNGCKFSLEIKFDYLNYISNIIINYI